MGAARSERDDVRGRLLAVLVVSATAVMAGPLAPGAPARGAQRPMTVERLHVRVQGEVARGQLAYPTDRPPTALVVYGHGCCGSRSLARIQEQLAFARTHGAAVVAMEYRGKGGWDVAAGAADVVVATQALQRRFPIRQTIAWGLSMGGEVTGMAVAARPDLFDWWVGTAGVYDLAEMWTNGTYRHLIERETGGTPASHPDGYRARSPVHLAARMKGIRGAFLVHGAGDSVVPQTQAWRMAEALRHAGVPASLEVVPLGHASEGAHGLAGHDGTVTTRSAAIVGDLLRRAA
jgi:dipeptidyl aminopeptidase/acylaminoacyl peptidase